MDRYPWYSSWYYNGTDDEWHRRDDWSRPFPEGQSDPGDENDTVPEAPCGLRHKGPCNIACGY
jgi:hypothetical protein